MLQSQGHTISGISLDPPERSLFNQAKLNDIFENDFRVDIRNRREVEETISKVDPEVIIHLAAQPLVRESYKFPIETFDTNVLGTLNVLEATKSLKNLKATLVITTDKVYKNHNHLRGYVETDELGGDDPYSASKAAADIATQSWIKSFATSPMAIARAGNVIGGGDWAADRIIPDLVTAYSKGQIPTLRYPGAIRPWQHVLDCLNGYLMLVDHQINRKATGEWNFGPRLDEKYTVADLVLNFSKFWQVEEIDAWKLDRDQNPHESGYLLLDSEKARRELRWSDKLNFAESIKWTAEWYKNPENLETRTLCEFQIDQFVRL